jgi:hypothetical protein
LKFDRQKFFEFSLISSDLFSVFVDLLQLKSPESLSYEELKTRMQLFQAKGVEKELLLKAEKITQSMRNPAKSEKILISWMKNALFYEKISQLVWNEKENIKKISQEIQKVMAEVKKLGNQKNKFESNQKVIFKFFEQESVSSHSTEATNSSKRSLTGGRQTKQSFDSYRSKFCLFN